MDAESVCQTGKPSNKMETGLTHECGVFGAIGNESWESTTEIAQIILIGLQALQHR